MFSFAGFGTLAVVHSSEHQADFTTNIFQPNGAGYTHDWSIAPDSLIAAQVSASLTAKLSAVVQILARQNYNDTFWPRIEWADLKYQFTPELSFRVGRTVLPTFLLSEARNVGYANPWVRPPLEVYSLNPITSSDGLDMSYKVRLGDVQQTFVAVYGSHSENLAQRGGAIKTHQSWTVADTIEYGPATLHVAYQQANLAVQLLGPLFDAFREFGPQGNALADKYDPQRERASFFGFGGIYDPGKWFVTGEWGRNDLHSVLGKTTGWYVSGGYRVAKFTPYLTYSAATADNLSDPGLDASALPPALAAEAASLNATLNSILRNKRVRSTISAGTRWDFMQNAALTLQFDHTRIGAGSSGGLVNIQPAFRLGGELNLVSAAVNFVF